MWLQAKRHTQWSSGTSALFQPAKERRNVHRSVIEPRWLSLEARNLPLDQTMPSKFVTLINSFSDRNVLPKN